MAIKQIAVSDITGAEIPDDQHTRVVIQHPDFTQALEIDATKEEAEKFQSTALRLVDVTIYAPNVPPRSVTLETKILDRLFGNVDFNKVLESARKAEQPIAVSRPGRPAKAAPQRPVVVKGNTADKPNYATMENMAMLHRGRITEAEAELVRNNMGRGSQNRERQSGSPIDWDDPKERKRYGLG